MRGRSPGDLAGALQQTGRIRQRCAMEEPHVNVRGGYIDGAEGGITRTAVMQDLPDFVPASSHHLKPLMRDGSQFISMLIHPRIDGGIAFDSTVESQQFCSHRRSIFAFGFMLRGTTTRGTNRIGPRNPPVFSYNAFIVGNPSVTSPNGQRRVRDGLPVTRPRAPKLRPLGRS